MADTTRNDQASGGGGSAGDTMEFLKLLGVAGSDAPAAPAAGAAQTSGAPARAGRMPSIDEAPAATEPPVPEAAATLNVAPVSAARRGGSKPVVIKGGPRRVVRADGVQPETTGARAQRRMRLSSGHAMFERRRKMSAKTGALLGVAALALIAVIILASWGVAQSTIRHDKQLDVVGTSDYDGSLSLTPANDGGYYTVFFVTSTPTDEEEIGELSQVVMYRTDKDVTTAMRITVPTNLAVATSSSDSTMIPLSQALTERGVSRALQGIDDAFGIRLWETVVCDEQDFARLAAIMEGAADTSSIDPQGLLGHVRSSFTLEQIVEYAGKIGTIGSSAITSFEAPTQAREGTDMVNGMSDRFAQAITNGGVSSVVLDEQGHPAGTQYDEAGNPLLDENGYPQNTIYDEGGQPVVDENGYVVIYGQQYDERGNFVGTQYDENGNPILDEWGNPAGTQYDENGDYVRDWRGNVVISA